MAQKTHTKAKVGHKETLNVPRCNLIEAYFEPIETKTDEECMDELHERWLMELA